MTNLVVIKLKPALHKEKEVVQLLFIRNDELTQLLRSATDMRWSKTMNCWYLPYYKHIIQDLFTLVKSNYYLDYSDLKTEPFNSAPTALVKTEPKVVLKPSEGLAELSKENNLKVDEFKLWMNSKRYSQNTIATYTDALKIFLRYFSHKPINEITNDDLIKFNNYYIMANHFSASFQNQVVNAVKLFFNKIENKKLDPELIHRPKRPKLLPNVLSKEEMKLILNAHSNIKHKAMLSLIYSCGLRRSELLNLKLTDIDSKRGLVIIRQSKG